MISRYGIGVQSWTTYAYAPEPQEEYFCQVEAKEVMSCLVELEKLGFDLSHSVYDVYVDFCIPRPIGISRPKGIKISKFGSKWYANYHFDLPSKNFLEWEEFLSIAKWVIL